MDILNLSSEPIGILHSWLPHDLKAKNVVFFPDACPGKSPLPTGIAVLTHQENWRKFAISDCGCGMRLARSKLSKGVLNEERWEATADLLSNKKGGLGDLGGGNHFVDALTSNNDDRLYFLIHTGSRNESGHVDNFVNEPRKFDCEFERVVMWAKENRSTIHKMLETVFGSLELLLDIPHNSYELLSDGGVVIRKGAVHVRPKDLNIIPSHMSGEIALIRATDKVKDSLFSLSHGTGRAMSRSDCKLLSDSFDFSELREKVLIPKRISDNSLRTEGPFAYRDLDLCLSQLNGYVEEIERFSVIGYIGSI